MDMGSLWAALQRLQESVAWQAGGHYLGGGRRTERKPSACWTHGSPQSRGHAGVETLAMYCATWDEQAAPLHEDVGNHVVEIPMRDDQSQSAFSRRAKGVVRSCTSDAKK